MRFCAVSSAKSPRIVPGAASCGRVAPTIARTTAIAFGPSKAGRDERARRDEVDEAAEERLLAMDGVVPLGERPIDVDQLQPDELQAALLEAGEDPPDEQALDAVGLDQDEGAFVHVSSWMGWSGRRDSGRIGGCGVGPWSGGVLARGRPRRRLGLGRRSELRSRPHRARPRPRSRASPRPRADDPVGVAADEGQDRLRPAGEQVEDGGASAGSARRARSRPAAAWPRPTGLERGSRPGEQLRRRIGSVAASVAVVRIPQARSGRIAAPAIAAGSSAPSGASAAGVERSSAARSRWPRRAGCRSSNSVADAARPARPDRPARSGCAACPAKTGRATRRARPSPCPASRRASPGRPRSACASAAITSASDVVGVDLEIRRRRLAGPGQVAGPPAGLGEIADPLVVERSRPASVSSSARASPSEPSRRWTRARTRSARALADVGRRSRPRSVGGAHAGSRRRRSRPRRWRAGRDDRQPQALVAEELAGERAGRRPASTAATAASASSSVRTRSWSASWPPIHDARWRVSSIRSSRPPDR